MGKRKQFRTRKHLCRESNLLHDYELDLAARVWRHNAYDHSALQDPDSVLGAKAISKA